MKRLIVVLVLAASSVGCGQWGRLKAGVSGWSKTCVEGVFYIQFASGATAQLDRAGKPVPCQ